MDDALLRYGKKMAMRIALFPLRLLGVKKNRVLLINGLAKNYGDNPKAVAEHLLQQNKGLDLWFAVNDPEKYRDMEFRGIRFVKYDSFAYYKICMTSQVLLSNSGGYSYVPLRKRQVVINTHHGGGAYKKVGRYVYEDTPLFRKDLRLNAKAVTRFLSTCTRFTEIIADSFLIEKEKFWEIGMPRNDKLLRSFDDERQVIRDRLGLKDGQKLVLYAPTYRKAADNYFKDSVAIDYGIDCDRVCRAMEQRFGGHWKFGYRLHPCITDRSGIIPETALDLCDYPDMQELLLAADAMINDFSSSMWDYMLTGRPSFLFAVDLAHYIATTDVETPVDQWPFPKSTNNDELERTILEFDEARYLADCKAHYEALGGCESGKATKLVAEYIYKQCGLNV